MAEQVMYIVRFVRQDGKPDEEYYYCSLELAANHFCLFSEDDSGLYESIFLLVYKDNMIKTLDQYEF